MSYLKFDKSQLINLEKSLSKDMLRVNRTGAYSVTTLPDCNTSKYDGLLVVPIAELNYDNYVLLSSIDETVIQHGAEFNMGLHRFQGCNYSPKGHKYIREFTMETVARTTYRVGGVVFSKERVFISNESRILIKYKVIEAQSEVTLRFRPIVAFRSVNELTHENNRINGGHEDVQNGISMALYEGLPRLFMQYSRKIEFIDQPYWYKNIEYWREQERGYDYLEDLYSPGFFEITLEEDDELIFSAGTSEANPQHFNDQYKAELAGRTSRLDFFNTLKNAGNQFWQTRAKGDYIIAGYPWFKCRARDEFISLPGLSFASKNDALFDKVMESALPAVKAFLKGKENTSQISEIEDPDALLWMIWAIQKYADRYDIKKAAKKYGDIVMNVVNFIRENRHPFITWHENGLLWVSGYDKPASWMNGTAWGRPTLPRNGYLVEINALWYNVLRFASEIAASQSDNYMVDLLNYQAEFAKTSFNNTFWNGNYLYDYVSDNDRNLEVRPNMIFAVSLTHSPLDRKQQKKVVDIVTRELLTPRGLRTLSPKSGQYKPIYVGNEIERSYNYHNGTVWPWLIGAFTEAYLKLNARSGLFFLERILAGFETEMGQACIGTLNELYDGNPPYTPRGAMSFAMSVAETLRAMSVLKAFEANNG